MGELTPEKRVLTHSLRSTPAPSTLHPQPYTLNLTPPTLHHQPYTLNPTPSPSCHVLPPPHPLLLPPPSLLSGNKYFSFKNAFGGGNGSNDHAKLKSENGFLKQNRKLVHECLRSLMRASEHYAKKSHYLHIPSNSGFWAQIPKNRF